MGKSLVSCFFDSQRRIPWNIAYLTEYRKTPIISCLSMSHQFAVLPSPLCTRTVETRAAVTIWGLPVDRHEQTPPPARCCPLVGHQCDIPWSPRCTMMVETRTVVTTWGPPLDRQQADEETTGTRTLLCRQINAH